MNRSASERKNRTGLSMLQHSLRQSCLNLSLLLGLALTNFAAEAQSLDAGEDFESSLGGFTIDNTISRVGHDFARYLGEWRISNMPAETYNLAVYERPSARWGNLIWVEWDRVVVYRQFMQLRSASIRDAAYRAAEHIHSVIQQRKLAALLNDSVDLDAGEL